MSVINWTNVTDFSQLPAQANSASSGTFWTGILYMLWIIMMLIMIYWGWEAAIMVSSFLALVIGLFLVYADLVNWYYILTFVGIELIMFLYIIWLSPKIRQ